MHTLPEGIDGDFLVFENRDASPGLPYEVQDVEGELICRCPTREIADAIKHALDVMPSYEEASTDDSDG